MSDNNTIKVNVEMGEGYRPTPRLAAAIDELDAALREAHGDEEVSGFAAFKVTFEDVIVSSYTVKLDAQWSPAGGLTGTKQLCSNENVTGVFKF